MGQLYRLSHNPCIRLFFIKFDFKAIKMPVISMFYGLIVTMYYLDTKQHKLPHIHVKYGEMEAVYQIPDGAFL